MALVVLPKKVVDAVNLYLTLTSVVFEFAPTAMRFHMLS